MDIYSEMAKKIITEQESIVGPVAIAKAAQVANLDVDWASKSVVVKGGDPSGTVDKLVDIYKELFGQISVEVCKEALSKLSDSLSPDQIPASLR